MNLDSRRITSKPALRRWLCEPLLHFLIAGALIFAVYDLLQPPADQRAQANQIVVTNDDLRQIAVAWLAQRGTVPTVGEMHALVDQKVREEMLSREAIALGLDKDDEMIRRRLAQKMDFLAADIAAVQNPSEAELRAWFRQNTAQFALPPRASFRHLYFSFDRGLSARDAAVAALAQLDAGADPASGVAADPFMFRDYYGERTPEQIAKEFGPDFAKAVFQVDPGGWQGPIRSGYGWHLVFVSGSDPGRIPAFEEVEPDVKSAWLDQKQAEIKRIAFEAMRARYAVIVPSIQVPDLKDLRIAKDALAASSLVPQ
jgi:peptidyl-prolyl cis-trans isomerase C